MIEETVENITIHNIKNAESDKEADFHLRTYKALILKEINSEVIIHDDDCILMSFECNCSKYKEYV